MKGNDAVLAVVASLEQLGIDYMVTGSYASNVHGVPRSTRDADFIIEAPPEEVGRLLAVCNRRCEPIHRCSLKRSHPPSAGSSDWSVRPLWLSYFY